jgi:hypothetical protein
MLAINVPTSSNLPLPRDIRISSLLVLDTEYVDGTQCLIPLLKRWFAQTIASAWVDALLPEVTKSEKISTTAVTAQRVDRNGSDFWNPLGEPRQFNILMVSHDIPSSRALFIQHS